jgi:hypothetical protein
MTILPSKAKKNSLDEGVFCHFKNKQLSYDHVFESEK